MIRKTSEKVPEITGNLFDSIWCIKPAISNKKYLKRKLNVFHKIVAFGVYTQKVVETRYIIDISFSVHKN